MKLVLDILSVIGTVGTLGFGFLSFYQWTALQTLRRAIKAHTQTAFNNFWNVGNEMDQLLNVVGDTNATLDHTTVMKRSSAARSFSVAARNEVINFGRQYADFVPNYEAAWKPDPILKKPSFWKRLLAVFHKG